jgi:hypothetical protein
MMTIKIKEKKNEASFTPLKKILLLYVFYSKKKKQRKLP